MSNPEQSPLTRDFLTIKQPIGDFYVTSLAAPHLLEIGYVDQRKLNSDSQGVQRADSRARISEIAAYLEDPDATFPTPIIVSASSEEIKINNGKLEIPLKGRIAEIIDGQHRFLGMKQAERSRLEHLNLVVVFMLDLEPFERAYVFSVINSKQRPVPKSLIYDLFELSPYRSPWKTCHEIARTLNADPASPFFQGLKMLGKKGYDSEYLTQGSFVNALVKKISSNPQEDEIRKKKSQPLRPDQSKPFRQYFIDGQDHIIVKILMNYFGAISTVFSEEWNPPSADNYVLRKTVGYEALMKAFDAVWEDAKGRKTATYEFFFEHAQRMKDNVAERAITRDNFDSSSGGARKLSDALIQAAEQ